MEAAGIILTQRLATKPLHVMIIPLKLFKQTITWAKFAVLQLNIFKGYVHIIPDHINCAMSRKV